MRGIWQLHGFLSYSVYVHRSKEVFNIEIVGVETAVILDVFKSLRLEATGVIVPDFPQLEAELVSSTQRFPVAE